MDLDKTATAEAAKYDSVWARDEYRASPSPGLRILPQALATLGANKIKPDGICFADFGCGEGKTVLELEKYGFWAMGIDLSSQASKLPATRFIEACLWDLPVDLRVHYGLCCDVMEHIPTDFVIRTLTNIRRVVRIAAFFQIAMFPDYFGPALIGEPLHLSVYPPEWWAEKFRIAGWTIETEVDKTYGDDYPYLLVHAKP